MLRAIVGGILTAAVLVWTAGLARAQGPSGGLGGGGGPSGGLGSGGGSNAGGAGGLGGSTLGGTSGLGGGGAAARTGPSPAASGRTGGSTQTYGANTAYAPYYGNPLAVGFPNTTGTAQTASAAMQYERAFPVQLSFGQPLGGTATVNRGGGTTPGLGTAVSGLGATGAGGIGGGTATVTNNLFGGANTAGIRRAPAYISEPVFDRPARMAGPALQSELQSVVSRSGRLPSRGGIQVSVDGRVVVLRGNVRNERERRLAEAVVRLTPGVREVRNLLQPQKPATGVESSAP